MLGLIESLNLLKGVDIARYKIVKSEKDLPSIFPYWLKADIPEHKTERKAVLKCSNHKEAKENLEFLRKKFSKEIIIAQESIDGAELILGLKEDKVFGRLLMIGFGGINAEVIKDTSFRALPIDKREIDKMIKELKLYPTLVSRRKYALDKFISLAEKVSGLDVKEADFNPVILNEKSAFIIDARVEPCPKHKLNLPAL